MSFNRNIDSSFPMIRKAITIHIKANMISLYIDDKSNFHAYYNKVIPPYELQRITFDVGILDSIIIQHLNLQEKQLCYGEIIELSNIINKIKTTGDYL